MFGALSLASGSLGTFPTGLSSQDCDNGLRHSGKRTIKFHVIDRRGVRVEPLGFFGARNLILQYLEHHET